MLAGPDTLVKLIPQREPMLMVDALISHEATKTISSFTVKPDNIFVQNGRFTEAGLIENMAQTAALRTGWIASQDTKAEDEFHPPVGVIGAVKDFKLFLLPGIHAKLITEVEALAEYINATIIKAVTRCDGKLMAEAELKIFIQEH